MLTITLLMITVCSLIIGGLLTFTATVIRARPPLEERTRGAESARSAMRLAIMMQVSKGPSGCVSQSDYPAGTFDINGFAATISCTQLEYFDTGKNRYGIITTNADPTKVGLMGFDGTPTGTTYRKDILGDVFVNGGPLVTRNSDVLVAGTGTEMLSIDYSSSTAPPAGLTATGTPAAARYQFATGAPVDCAVAAVGADTFPTGVASQVNPSATYSHVHDPCVLATPAPWWSRAGDDSNTRDTNAVWNYPRLPNVPIYDRDGKYVDLTPTCRMYYPGRYDNTLTLDATGGRQHYFASGIYQFKATVTIASGAKVVFGAGKFPGCAVDSDLALNPAALANHAITGRGATLVLDGAGKLAIASASVQINRRVSTAATRGSEGVAIRTVNLGTATAALQVPTDMVQEAEYACTVDEFGACKVPFVPDVANAAGAVTVGAHQRPLATVTATTYLKYGGSTLAATDNAVSVDFQATTSQSGARFEVDGYIFTPNARFLLRTPSSGANMRAYRFVAGSGIVATQVELNAAQLPTTPSANWRVGAEAQPTQLRVALIARMTNPSGRQVTSRAMVEVRSNSSYAVNQWTVDPDQAIIVDPLAPSTTTGATTGGATTTTVAAPLPTLPVSGAAMWLDASNGASVVRGASVTGWNDISGNGRHLTLGTSGDTSISYATNALNNRPGVVTTGVGLLKSAPIDFGPNATVFVVGRMRSTPYGRVLSSPGNNWLLGWWGGLEDQAYYEGWQSQAWSAASPVSATTEARMYTSVTNGTTGSFYRNGLQLSSSAGGVATPRGISVGGWDTGEYSNAAVSEVIVYDRALTPTERTTVESYLAAKWWDTAANPLPRTLPVTGAAMWLDAANASSVVRGASVTAWYDLSGNNRHLTLGSSGNTSISYSTNALNNRAAVVTSGAGALTSANIDFGPSATVFVVARMRSTPYGRVLTSPGNNWLLGWWGGLQDQAYYEGWLYNPNTAPTTDARMYTSVTNGSTGSVYRNGTLLSSSAAAVATPRGISVGGGPTWEYSNAAVSEVIVYDRALSQTERATVEGYLAAKWWDTGSNPLPTTPTTTTTTTTTTTPPTTTTVPAAPCPTITGWKGEYFLGTALAGPSQLCRNDATLSFWWGTAGPGGSLPADQFSARWTKTVAFQAGTYRFAAASDDGFRLSIDGALVYSGWTTRSNTTETVDVTLSAGNHTLVAEYFEEGGQAGAFLDWAPVSRYVRVQLAGTNYLSLAEVRVSGFDVNGHFADRALGSPTTQSTTDYGGIASRAVDGTTNGNYNDLSTTHSGWETQPWWQVDLREAYALETIDVFNRTDCCMDRLSNYTVFLSSTDMTGRTYAQLMGDPAVVKVTNAAYPSPSVSISI